MEDVGMFFGHLVYFCVHLVYFCVHLVYFIVIWYFFLVLVCCAKKNLAALIQSVLRVPLAWPRAQLECFVNLNFFKIWTSERPQKH
jgi:hypothetical protein